MVKDNDFEHRYGILYHRFRENTYWWVVVTLLRRTILVALVAYIQKRGERFAAVSILQLAFVIMQAKYNPFLLQAENALAFLSLAFLLILTISLGSYPFPYSLPVQAFVTLTIFLPALGMVFYMVYDKVRQQFFPTEKEKRDIKSKFRLGLLVSIMGHLCVCRDMKQNGSKHSDVVSEHSKLTMEEWMSWRMRLKRASVAVASCERRKRNVLDERRRKCDETLQRWRQGRCGGVGRNS